MTARPPGKQMDDSLKERESVTRTIEKQFETRMSGNHCCCFRLTIHVCCVSIKYIKMKCLCVAVCAVVWRTTRVHCV